MSRLSEYPYVIVRIACTRCSRNGQYRLARLAERYGAETRLTDVLAKLSAGCPHADTAQHQGIHDRCGAFIATSRSPPRPTCRRPRRGCVWSVDEPPNRGAPVLTSRGQPLERFGPLSIGYDLILQNAILRR